MKETKVTITCDRCKTSVTEVQWHQEHRRKGTQVPRMFDPSSIIGGDFCAECSEEFNDKLIGAYIKWNEKAIKVN